ncbi:MAG: hypothetical protein RAO94_08625 [Candidatus Stygibacter australis]|nr:hypothetical protein [Candidatus Stygibacter australis]MDP8322399.1 hypothetical protein [Candidatus Stygibacter australis]
MKYQSRTFIVVLIMVTLYISSCDCSSSDVDVTAPKIEITYPFNETHLSEVANGMVTVSDKMSILNLSLFF